MSGALSYALQQKKDAVDDKGNALDPFKELYELQQTAAKRQKRQLHENPYDVFPAA